MPVTTHSRKNRGCGGHIFWTLYCKLDESERKELIKQLMVKPKSSPKIKVEFNQDLPVELKPLDAI